LAAGCWHRRIDNILEVLRGQQKMHCGIGSRNNP
jgi:hypothetical protein